MPADQAMIRQEAGCSDIEANNKEVESYQHNAAADDEDSSSDVEDLHDSDDFPTCSGDEEEEEFVTPVLKPVIRVPKATKEDQLKFNQLIRNILKAFHVTEENFGVPPNQSVMFLTHNFYLWWLDRKLVPLDLNPRAPDIAKAVNEHIALFPSAIPFTGNDLLALVAWLDADGHPPRFMQNAGIPGEIDIRAADLDTQNLPAFLHRCKELNIMETHDKSGYNLLIRAVTTIIGSKHFFICCKKGCI
ncbi:hypothetical protein DFH27DRAFT_604113 [Peziza echinospora]|nr:hypothetical protein DFH27DRAFT_604113 [Peziza echinospora]